MLYADSEMRGFYLIVTPTKRGFYVQSLVNGKQVRTKLGDHPAMDANWRRTLLVCRTAGGDPVVPDVTVTPEPQVPVRLDLLELFEITELEKYFTEAELAEHPGRSS